MTLAASAGATDHNYGESQMPERAIIAANVKKLMNRQHVTRKELSRRLTRIFDRGFSVSTVDRILSGNHKIADRQLAAIARMLNVPSEALMPARKRA